MVNEKTYPGLLSCIRKRFPLMVNMTPQVVDDNHSCNMVILSWSTQSNMLTKEELMMMEGAKTLVPSLHSARQWPYPIFCAVCVPVLSILLLVPRDSVAWPLTMVTWFIVGKTIPSALSILWIPMDSNNKTMLYMWDGNGVLETWEWPRTCGRMILAISWKVTFKASNTIPPRHPAAKSTAIFVSRWC